MQVAPHHPHERQRIEALSRYGVLDTAPEQAFDDLTQIASALCGRPISLVSLVDTDRQWFKSRHGLDAEETPRDLAFCAHAILEEEPIFEIPDASADPRFHDNPLVTGAPHVATYAGATLRTPDGLPLGTLCVIGHEPVALSSEQRQGLERLARIAESLLAQRMLLDDLAATTRRAIELEEVLKSYTGRTAWATLSDLDSGSVPAATEDELMQAYVFADMTGFTRLSEQLSPGDLAALLNSRLDPAVSLVHAHGGDVEKFIGDAVFAVFPTSTDALNFAVDLQAQAAEQEPVFGEPLQFSVGVHCGRAVRVHLGSQERRDNTLIGAAVNLAARLQSACPPGGILISELSLQRAGVSRRGESRSLTLKGFSEPIAAQLFVQGGR